MMETKAVIESQQFSLFIFMFLMNVSRLSIYNYKVCGLLHMEIRIKYPLKIK